MRNGARNNTGAALPPAMGPPCPPGPDAAARWMGSGGASYKGGVNQGRTSGLLGQIAAARDGRRKVSVCPRAALALRP